MVLYSMSRTRASPSANGGQQQQEEQEALPQQQQPATTAHALPAVAEHTMMMTQHDGSGRSGGDSLGGERACSGGLLSASIIQDHF